MPAPLALTVTDEIGVKPNTLVYRLRRGWTLDRALDIANGGAR